MPSCSTCRSPIAARPQNPYYPFCSERCRLIDLGRWLGEDYRIPSDEPADPSDLAAAALDPTHGKPN